MDTELKCGEVIMDNFEWLGVIRFYNMIFWWENLNVANEWKCGERIYG